MSLASEQLKREIKLRKYSVPKTKEITKTIVQHYDSHSPQELIAIIEEAVAEYPGYSHIIDFEPEYDYYDKYCHLVFRASRHLTKQEEDDLIEKGEQEENRRKQDAKTTRDRYIQELLHKYPNYIQEKYPNLVEDLKNLEETEG